MAKVDNAAPQVRITPRKRRWQGCGILRVQRGRIRSRSHAAGSQPATARGLVRAAREERHQHHQVGQSEQPLFGLDTSRFGRPGDHAQVTAAREVVQVIDANAGQAGNFGVRKDLLTGFDSNQKGPR